MKVKAKVIGTKPLAALKAETESAWLALNPLADLTTEGKTTSELAALWNVSRCKAEREVARLVSAGRLKLIGRKRSGRTLADSYELV